MACSRKGEIPAMLKSIRSTFIMIHECISMSISNIWGNKVRSFLTVLGILIGVTAVIALITTVSGVSSSITSSFTSLGAGTISVSISGSDLKSGLTRPENAHCAHRSRRHHTNRFPSGPGNMFRRNTEQCQCVRKEFLLFSSE